MSISYRFFALWLIMSTEALLSYELGLQEGIEISRAHFQQIKRVILILVVQVTSSKKVNITTFETKKRKQFDNWIWFSAQGSGAEPSLGSQGQNL